MSQLLVIGSTNIDLVMQLHHLPKPGETVGQGNFVQVNGGKGANQAVAAARAGGTVRFISCVGDDIFGPKAIVGLASKGMDIRGVKLIPETATGTALIFVDAQGENCIGVAPGANAHVKPEMIDAAMLQKTAFILMQLEIPLPTVQHVLALAEAKGKKVMLNPAPAQKLSSEDLARVHTLVVNESEAAFLSKQVIDNEEHAKQAAQALLQMGPEAVVLTLGARGCMLVTGSDLQQVPAFVVEAVDTTAAGDVFCGALAVALSEGKALAEAARFASAAAAISVTRLGAQPSAPHRKEIETFLRST